MITENELNISNKSYINKDFGSVYSELVSLLKSSTYKFDPETSNESDPFILLLKSFAFGVDKTNYISDKNALEVMMPSATQESTMRSLTSMLGYNMSYYVAPETNIYIKYIGEEEFTGTHLTFTFSKLNTIITDSEGDTQFVLVEDCIIDGYNVTPLRGTKALQGYKSRLTVLNNDDESEKVLLENLDENNRIYFNEKKVAQNGVFITGGTMSGTSNVSGYWDRVDNLNIQQLGSYVYLFGYDSSKGYPYVQFPNDIASLIGDGLTIDYIVTDGLSGNISAKKLNTLKSPVELTWDGTEDTISFSSDENSQSVLVINNTNGTINGNDPEGINQAYSNYKKIIGTFDTLVTCRDYNNAIYNMKDDDDIYYIVSNVQVADRRTDLNNSTNIVTYSSYGKEYYNTVRLSGTSPKISAYDLILYPMTSIKTYSIDNFKNCFTPLDTYYHTQLENNLEDSGCISHNYIYPSKEDIFAIKNYYKLNAFITTINKVTKTEGASILANINKALIETFNAREVDFGYELPYQTLYDTILSADERIKAVSLYEPELETKYLTNAQDEKGNYIEHSLFDKDDVTSQDMFITTIAKNVMSGRVELYNYYDTFTFSLGQVQTKGYLDGSESLSNIDIVYNNIEKVTTEANITIPSSTSSEGYTLLDNEVVQIVTPSLVTKATYPYGLNYYLYLKDDVTTIPQNTEYELKSGELCVIEYTDSTTKSQVVKIYTHNITKPIIIKPNFDMYTTKYRMTPRSGYSKGETPLSKLIEKQIVRDEIASIVSDAISSEGKLSMFTLTTNDQVEYREINQVDMSSTSYCAWIMNNNSNKIIWDSNNQHMLEEGEYFFQTDLGYNELLSYGSGTVITKNGYVGDSEISWENKTIDVTALDELGLLGHKEFFKKIVVTSGDYLNFLEQQVITLTTNDSIRTSTSSEEIKLGNEFNVNLNNKGIEYKLSDEGTWTPLTNLSYTSSTYNYHKARGILDINCGPDTPQTLIGNQSMTFYTKEGETHKSIKVVNDGSTINPIVKLERLHQTFGGNEIEITSININDSQTILYDSVCIYQVDDDYKASNLDDEYEALTLSAGDKDTKTYSVPKVTSYAITMVYIDGDDIEFTYKDCEISDVARNIENVTTLQKGINNLMIHLSGDEPTFTFALKEGSSSASITIRVPRHLNESNIYNNDVLGLTNYSTKTSVDINTLNEKLLTKIREIDINKDVIEKGFFYCCDIDNSKTIEYDDLSSPYSLYDYNNIANKWTISEIEFSDSFPSIDIARGSYIQ